MTLAREANHTTNQTQPLTKHTQKYCHIDSDNHNYNINHCCMYYYIIIIIIIESSQRPPALR